MTQEKNKASKTRRRTQDAGAFNCTVGETRLQLSCSNRLLNSSFSVFCQPSSVEGRDLLSDKPPLLPFSERRKKNHAWKAHLGLSCRKSQDKTKAASDWLNSPKKNSGHDKEDVNKCSWCACRIPCARLGPPPAQLSWVLGQGGDNCSSDHCMREI